MRPIKSLGQNFLTQPEIATRIVELAEVAACDRVWEIGPGHGILTRALLKTGCLLKAFELDRRLEAPLREEFGNSVDLVFGDILRLDWVKELASECRPIKLVANIPYNITSPLLSLLERHHERFQSATLMLQKEVAERVTARPGTKAYGVMTLRLKRIFDASILLQVGREHFAPVPQVDSAVVSLKPRADKPLIPDLEKYLALIDLAFAHRRKTLRNNLLSHYDHDRIAGLQDQSGIDLKRRGETLSETEFITLSSCL